VKTSEAYAERALFWAREYRIARAKARSGNVERRELYRRMAARAKSMVEVLMGLEKVTR
jgi:hypothetical protein